MTKKQKRMAIVVFAIVGLLIFCIVPFVELTRGMFSVIEGYPGLLYLVEGEGDLQYYVALCALLPLGIIILQFLKIPQAENLTKILSWLSFLALAAVLLNADGDLRGSSLYAGAPVLLFIDYIAITCIVMISTEKISMQHLLKGAGALSALTAIAVFCAVAFFMPDWSQAAGLTGLDMFDLMDFTNDSSPLFSLLCFILIPIIVAIIQVVGKGRIRFFSTFALWLPFFFFMAVLPEYSFTIGAYIYMLLSVATSYIAYRLIGVEKNEAVPASVETPEN